MSKGLDGCHLSTTKLVQKQSLWSAAWSASLSIKQKQMLENSMYPTFAKWVAPSLIMISKTRRFSESFTGLANCSQERTGSEIQNITNLKTLILEQNQHGSVPFETSLAYSDSEQTKETDNTRRCIKTNFLKLNLVYSKSKKTSRYILLADLFICQNSWSP